MADRETDLRNLKAIKSRLEKIKDLERRIESEKASIRKEEKKIEDVNVSIGRTDDEKETRNRIKRRHEGEFDTIKNSLIAITIIVYIVLGAIATYKAYVFLMANAGSFEFIGVMNEESAIFFTIGIGLTFILVAGVTVFLAKRVAEKFYERY